MGVPAFCNRMLGGDQDGSCKFIGAECFGFGLIGNGWSVVFWSNLAYLRNKGIYEFYDILLFACSLLHFPSDKGKHLSSAKASVASLPATNGSSYQLQFSFALFCCKMLKRDFPYLKRVASSPKTRTCQVHQVRVSIQVEERR